MNDKQLLELAAKASGIPGLKYRAGPCIPAAFIYDYVDAYTYKEWNPLTDDGDALRLACELRIHVGFFRGMVAVQGPKGGQKSVPIRENGAREPTRRAIVLAAAEIGSQTREVNDAN